MPLSESRYMLTKCENEGCSEYGVLKNVPFKLVYISGAAAVAESDLVQRCISCGSFFKPNEEK